MQLKVPNIKNEQHYFLIASFGRNKLKPFENSV
jgi:hypothetical protein